MKNASRFKEYSNATTYRIEAKEQDYLYTMKSQIPDSGNGLFTAIPIYKDEVISIFKGEILSDKEAQRRATNGDDEHFINLPDGTIMDSLNVKCFAKYANDASGLVKTVYKNNSKITLDENGKVCLVATKKILIGAEIFCSYGKKYWKKYSLNYQEVLPMKKVLSALIVAIVALSFSAVVFAAETIKTDTKSETTTSSPTGEVKVEKKEIKKVVKKTKKSHKKAKKEVPVPAPAVTPAPM